MYSLVCACTNPFADMVCYNKQPCGKGTNTMSQNTFHSHCKTGLVIRNCISSCVSSSLSFGTFDRSTWSFYRRSIFLSSAEFLPQEAQLLEGTLTPGPELETDCILEVV